MKPEDILKKYPRIVSHLIAESLGYFTPKSATIAIIKAKENEPYFCELYTDCARRYGEMYDRDNVRRVTREILSQAIKSRHHHTFMMASYKDARLIVDEATKGNIQH
ncbi:hypothetical protein SAMN05446037_1006140 [Anaerovirgula multivorans]|uniref:Uncharacterized protein n=1 Tax=Anaerovirgula multivorans TaxID=312168 RepID=A0A239CT97_9FIRM|nr:hypothetical protein [Anaerovirgula multivorans]SNS23330.1 hypothetical protein SAMN05446037_1006140 [Anaerovirgula multivorans]